MTDACRELTDAIMQRLLPVPETVIILPRCPSVWDLYRGTKRGQRRPLTPEYDAWIKEAGWSLKLQKPGTILGRVALLIEVGETGVKALADCSNYVKAPEDLLVRHGIIEGDDRRYVRESTARWAQIEGMRITVRSCG